MNNSFNICPRCGNANALNAKYCSRCGGQLKIPEEPVVCPKCHTRNTPMANFCRNCGVELKVCTETKICPKCGKEVGAHDNVCVCGYSFVTLQQTAPNAKATKSEKETQSLDSAKTTKTKAKKVYKTKGGRGWAIAALVLLLLFAYYVVVPYVICNEAGDTLATLRPDFLVNLDGGFANDGEALATAYGYDYVFNCILLVSQGASFAEMVESFGMGNVLIMVVTLATMIAMFTHLIICIVRICTGKRSKYANWTYLVLAVISTLVVGLIALFHYVTMPEIVTNLIPWFILGEGFSLGFAIWAMPLYFWFFFLYSLGAKAKKLQENT